MARSGLQDGQQPVAAARQPRHDRANRNARHSSDLLVRQAFELPKHHHLTELDRQLLENRPYRIDGLCLYQPCFGIQALSRGQVAHLVEDGRLAGALA